MEGDCVTIGGRSDMYLSGAPTAEEELYPLSSGPPTTDSQPSSACSVETLASDGKGSASLEGFASHSREAAVQLSNSDSIAAMSSLAAQSLLGLSMDTTVAPPDASLTSAAQIREALKLHPCKSSLASTTSHLPPSNSLSCWGAKLMGSNDGCDPDFQGPGDRNHFINKFCSCCSNGIRVDKARVFGQFDSELLELQNLKCEGSRAYFHH